MSDRESILGRVRTALAVPTRRDAGAPVPVRDAEAIRAVLPEGGDDHARRKELFAKHAVALQMDFRVVSDQAMMLEEIQSIARAESWEKIATHQGRMTDAAGAALGLPTCRTDDGYDKEALGACDAGITECEALVAQTGSVLTTTLSSGGRALSVLPPHHVVLATGAQLLSDLPAAFAFVQEKYQGGYPSLISFITGASRTGDIERILVLGAHGPKKLTVILVESLENSAAAS